MSVNLKNRKYSVEKIRQVRLLGRDGMRAKDIARRTGICPQYVSDILDGSRRKVD
jgi:hypothetical protein